MLDFEKEGLLIFRGEIVFYERGQDGLWICQQQGRAEKFEADEDLTEAIYAEIAHQRAKRGLCDPGEGG